MGRYFMLHVCILCEIYGEHKWYANMIQYNIIAPGTLKPNSFLIAVLVSQIMESEVEFIISPSPHIFVCYQIIFFFFFFV